MRLRRSGRPIEGGPRDGRMVGSIGDIGCYSFNGNKLITTGGGGMLVTDDEAIAHDEHGTCRRRHGYLDGHTITTR